MNYNKQKGGVVFSTDKGRICPECTKPSDECQCRDEAVLSSGDGIVRLCMETKGRKGKGMTLVTGLPHDQELLKKIAKRLKAKCGSGGTVKNGVIEVQGDHRQQLFAELQKEGYKVKLAGG